MTTAPDPQTKKINAAFNEAAGQWDQEKNIFYRLHDFNDAEFRKISKDPAVIAEFRQLLGKGTSRAPLTKEEKAQLTDIHRQAAQDVQTHPGLSLEAAESLRLACLATGVEHHQFMQRLYDTDGNIAHIDPNNVTKAGPFKFDEQTWLHLVKEHGAEHGLSRFADKIKLEKGPDGAETISVADPAALREILFMRNSPRLSAIMGAEYIKHESEIHSVTYKGVSETSSPALRHEQQALMKLGFDVGLRNADGIEGPMTQAAIHEFMQMHKVKSRADFDGKLNAVLAQAEKDSKQFSRDGRVVSAPEAHALRHASDATGVPLKHILSVATAERAFDKTCANPNRSPGLFHMKDAVWLRTVAEFGGKYGLGDLVKDMRFARDKDGHVTGGVTIQDPLLRKYILNLRRDPHVSALMGAEHARHAPDIQNEIAETYLGERAVDNREDLSRFMGTHGQQMTDGSGRPFDPSKEAWCAAFLISTLDGAGIKTDGLTPGVTSFEDYGTGVAKKDARRGDIIIVRDKDGPCHVTMVDRVDSGGIHTIGGNQGFTKGNRGVTESYVSDGAIYDIRRPPPADALKSCKASRNYAYQLQKLSN